MSDHNASNTTGKRLVDLVGTRSVVETNVKRHVEDLELQENKNTLSFCPTTWITVEDIG